MFEMIFRQCPKAKEKRKTRMILYVTYLHPQLSINIHQILRVSFHIVRKLEFSKLIFTFD